MRDAAASVPSAPTRLEPWARAAVLASLALITIGVVMVYSASSPRAAALYGDSMLFLRRQLAWAGIGVVAMFVAMRADPTWLRRHAHWLVGGALALLAVVLVPALGTEINGARRWFRLGRFSLQPSELTKLALVIWLAHHLAARARELDDFKRGVLPAIVVLGAAVLLTLPEPDFGTAVFLGAVGGAMLLVGGLPMRGIGLLALVALPFMGWQVGARWELMVKRFSVLGGVGPDGGPVEQVQNGLVALGAGGATGVGLGAGRQKLFFLPEAQTDFILPVIGEELGFVGTAAVVLLFMVFVGCGMRVAIGAAVRDRFLFLLAFGLVLLVGLQAAGNIAVVTGSVPTKGIALPFVSLGGSSLVVLCVAVGLIHAAASRADAMPAPAPAAPDAPAPAPPRAPVVPAPTPLLGGAT